MVQFVLCCHCRHHDVECDMRRLIHLGRFMTRHDTIDRSKHVTLEQYTIHITPLKYNFVSAHMLPNLMIIRCR